MVFAESGPTRMAFAMRLDQTFAPKVDLMGPYRARLAAGWQPDAAQALAVTRLQNLASALMSDMATPPKGLWLYGPPGRGKSQLLDMFMEKLPFAHKRRVHFHAFMDELNRRMHAMPPKAGEDFIGRLAKEINAEATVLGFDEFYLTNLPDAMLLGRLMQQLFAQGTVVVATSNWALPDLFQGGLNRDRFLPLLRTLERHLEPLDLGGSVDYRAVGQGFVSDYIVVPAGESAVAQLDVLFEEYADGPKTKVPPFVQAKKVRGRAIWLTFAEACDRALGRREYQELVTGFNTLILEGIPKLMPHESDAALRLATLVDIWFERNRRLVVSAAVPAGQICVAGPAAEVFMRTASRLQVRKSG